MMTPDQRPGTGAFWIDYGYDADNASDGISRYGAYVRQRAATAFADCYETWDDRRVRMARFAETAWQTATGPVMAPGYVRHDHPRVLSGRVLFNGWDATLTGAVNLATPWPAPLARSREGWQWRNWLVESVPGGPDFYREPGDEELTRGSWLLASARLLFPLRLDGLPEAPDGPGDGLEGKARTAVGVLVAAMNAAVVPVIEALERA
jgi:hypothetical protein